MKAAAELTSALKGTVSRDAETADALAKVSDLFHKIAAAKADRAKAKEQQNHHRTHRNSRRAVPLPRVDNKPSARQAVPIPRVQATPAVDDCRVVGGGRGLQIVACGTPNQAKHGLPSTRPHYILQDDDEEQQHGYTTRSRTTSIMQEAMMACIDITKPTFELSAQKMASQKLPMTWICEMANSML